MGELFNYAVAGGGFFLIGAWEAILSSSETLKNPNHSLSSPTQSPQKSPLTSSSNISKTTSYSSPISFFATLLLSLFFIINSIFSLTDALDSRDQTGVVLQLEVISIAALFWFFSLLGFLKNTFPIPSSLLNLLCLFGFVEEFILFYLQKKDPSGIENRYYDLLLVPISFCVFSTLIELKTPESNFPRLGRAVGLILQGMWFVQMGLSFFSDLMVHGCSLHERSKGNYTVRCKGHPEYHRARAIATLLFNCHLALLVALVVGAYAIICKKYGVRKESMHYRPIGAEMMPLDSHAQFTLESDDEGDDNENGIRQEGNVTMDKAITIMPEMGVNGYGSQH